MASLASLRFSMGASLIMLLLLLPSLASAGVEVKDDIAVTGEAIMLGAKTKGLFLARGGELVEFSVDDKVLGKNLSGGDGWAYREFTPKREKLYKVKATSGKDSGTGLLLSLTKGRGILFIDVQGSLIKPPFSKLPREGSLEIVKKLSEKYHVVYLYAEFPEIVIRVWLKENEFPDAPLFGWRGGMIFDDIVEKGLKVKVVIGSASVVQSALEYKAKLFTFEVFDEATEVGSWEEIEKGLILEGK